MSTPAAMSFVLHTLLGCDFGTKASVPGVDDREDAALDPALALARAIIAPSSPSTPEEPA